MRRTILWAGGSRVITVGVAALLAVMLGIAATTLPATMFSGTAFAQASNTVTLDPTSGPPGTKVTANGKGWPHGVVNVAWDGEWLPEETKADAAGNFTLPFTVPQNATPGSHTVSFDGQQGSWADVSFTVTKDAPATVTLERAYTRNGEGTFGQEQTEFTPGDVIRYAVDVRNSGSTTLTAKFVFTATGPREIFSWEGDAPIEPRHTGFHLHTTVPTDAPPGTYTLRVTMTYNGQSSTKESQFTVAEWILPMRGAQVIGFRPGQGDHVGRDKWAVDFYSDNPAVYPARAGEVVYAQWNCERAEPTPDGTEPCYGNVVVIDHGGGLYSIYTHLAATGLATVDQSVSTSDRIGTMSDSGCSNCGVHLHFAARRGNPNLGGNALFGANTPVRTPWR